MSEMPDCLKDLTNVRFNDAEEKELAAYARALGHPARVRLLRILASGQCLSGDLVGQIGLAQSTVSEHLRILREAGLVEAQVQHPKKCFYLRPQALERVRQLLSSLGEI